MTTQRRGRRDAENVIEAIGPAPVKNLRAAIVAVGAQHDFRPVGPDRAQEAAQEGAISVPFGQLVRAVVDDFTRE